MRSTHRTPRILATVAVLALGGGTLAACGGDDDTAAGGDDSTDTAMTDDTAMTEDTAMADDDMADEIAGPSGPACAQVPTSGEGSVEGMADDPVGTAASNNPLLTTLVAAVSEAGLVDTLNGPGPFTVFAPVNDAFAAIPADQLAAAMADTDQLTSILTFHVVPEQLSSAQLAEKGSVTTVQGDELTFDESGGSLTVNDSASVICMDVPTANATVHLIDGVLMPSA